MIVYLVRHGLSAANVAGLVTGTPADRLVDQGVEQATALSEWLRDARVEPQAFYVSHWGRARQTAELLFSNAVWKEDRRLGETDAGNVAEQTLPVFLESWSDFYGSNSNCYPGGESHLDLNNRVLSFWREMAGLKLASVMLVSHSGPISCILQNVLGVGMVRFPAFLPAQASVSVLEAIGKSSEGDVQFRLKGFALGPLANIGRGVTG
jgi:glucosyl-3-phosphoglycerate phosphatase